MRRTNLAHIDCLGVIVSRQDGPACRAIRADLIRRHVLIPPHHGRPR